MATAFIEAGVTELSYVGSTQTDATGGTLTPHGSAQAGDIAVLLSYVATGTVSLQTPSGWTLVVSSTDGGLGNASGRIHYKVLTSGDLIAGVSGIASGSVQRQIMLVFHPDDDIDAVLTSSPNGFAAASDPPDQSVSASGQQTPLVVIGWNGCTNVADDDMTSSPGFDATIQNTNAARAGYKIYNSTPANHTISATGSGARVLQSFYIQVS